MPLSRRTLIVMPAFNEEASVAEVVREVFLTNPGAEVLVVDDGSWDSTSRMARSAGARVATLPFNLGVGGAMRTDTTSGYRASGPRAVALFAEHYPAEYLGDTIEALVIAARSGLTVRQVPVSMRPRSGGVPSHNPLKSAIYLGRAALALTFAFMRPASTYHSGGAA
jgi:glycosyltransferase involved in cell wall biosynthesis